MIKVCITGSSGFIGRHIAKTFGNNKKIKLSYCELPKCDLLKPDSIQKFVAGQDVIIHAAAINRGSGKEIIAGNVAATINLIRAMESEGSRPKLIFLSSIHSGTDTVYGKSKELAEIALKDYSQESKRPVTIFRLTNIFGEGCRPFYNSVVATFCHQATRGEKLVINNGNREINLMYIKDLVKIIEKEIFIPHKPPFYFKRIVSNNKVTVSNLAEVIQSFKNGLKLKKSKFHNDLYNTYLSYKNGK